jgi:hypothetical protein
MFHNDKRESTQTVIVVKEVGKLKWKLPFGEL